MRLDHLLLSNDDLVSQASAQVSCLQFIDLPAWLGVCPHARVGHRWAFTPRPVPERNRPLLLHHNNPAFDQGGVFVCAGYTHVIPEPTADGAAHRRVGIAGSKPRAARTRLQTRSIVQSPDSTAPSPEIRGSCGAELPRPNSIFGSAGQIRWPDTSRPERRSRRDDRRQTRLRVRLIDARTNRPTGLASRCRARSHPATPRAGR